MCGRMRVCMRGAYYNQYLRVFTKYYNIIIHFIVLCIDIKKKRQRAKGEFANTCYLYDHTNVYTIITCKYGVSCVCVCAPDGSRPVSLNGRLINGKQILLLLNRMRCKPRRFPLRSSNAHIVFVLLLLKYVYTRRASPQRVPVALGGQFCSARAQRKKHLPY